MVKAWKKEGAGMAVVKGKKVVVPKMLDPVCWEAGTGTGMREPDVRSWSEVGGVEDGGVRI